MDAGEVLAGPEAARLIARAAKVAQTAVAVHAYTGPESAKMAGCGACAEACAFVHTLPWGPQACRRSREKPAQTALKRGRPVPYLCHMGFACVAAPIGPAEAGHVAMFGPFSPAETPAALEHDARHGLEKLENARREELPFTFADIPAVHSEVVPEVAEWLQETLLKQFDEQAKRAETHQKSDNETVLKQTPSRISSRRAPVRDAYNARAILAALANPDSASVREAIANALRAGRAPQKPEKLRARTVAVVAAVGEAASEHGRRPVAVPALNAGVLDAIATFEDAVRVVTRALAPTRRAILKAADASGQFYTAFERYVEERLGDALSLDAAAKYFALPPSTLTRRLERRYGLTFTGYVARRRVERAKTLLAKNTLSVDAIAKRVGLTDGAHLRKLLNRFEGTTPSEVRQAQR